MSSLWNGLTGGGVDSRLLISQHLLSTLDILIEEASSKLWRTRVGACGALAEIISGREWDDLGGGGPVLNDDDLLGESVISAGIRFLRLWRVAMRSMVSLNAYCSVAIEETVCHCVEEFPQIACLDRSLRLQ
jgi:proteasome component ECM29